MHGQNDVAETAANSPAPGLPPPASLVHELATAALVPTGAHWQSLCGGRTNQVWLVRSGAYERVVKLYSRDAETPLFANDNRAEALVLRALAATGLSPRPAYSGNSSAGPVLIYDHQKGTTWRSDPQPVAIALKTLHSLPLAPQLEQLPLAPDGSVDLIAQTMMMLAQIPRDLAEPIIARRPVGHIPPTAHHVLLHGDPVPGNLICCTDGASSLPVLVDWQCPALGDPVMDLALFLSPAMQHVGRGKALSDQERDCFLARYDDPAVTDRLKVLQPFLHWRMATYCLWKTTRSRPDPAYAPALELELAALASVTG